MMFHFLLKKNEKNILHLRLYFLNTTVYKLQSNISSKILSDMTLNKLLDF